MSNTLYLKYRPQTLGEIIGQEEIVNVLKNSIAKENISHAYLLTGTRGTGKTTTARAFAKELGIHKDDILELDAASNNGVEEIRAITEGVYTLPFFSKYKMYILDEAHMITKQAGNALLKTLEEPPAHCIFVLCTTDPEKMLETILSRCVKFNLKSPTQEVLSKFLQQVSNSEGAKIDVEALNLIAFSGNGSYRDALSNLQKVLSFDEKYTEELVGRVLGIAPTTAVFLYLSALDGLIELEKGVEVLKQLEDAGVDAILFAKEVVYYARLVMLFRHKLISEQEIRGEHTEQLVQELGKFIQNKQPKINSKTLADLINGEISVKASSFPFLYYELLLM